MANRPRLLLISSAALLMLAGCFLQACSSSYGGGGGGGGNPPSAPTGLAATAGNKQVSLSWSASTGATSYNVKRGTATGGPYTTISSPTQTSYVDTGLANGTTYYYVVSAVNTYGESANSSEMNAAPASGGTSVQVTVNVLSNRHTISNYVYGGAFPQDAGTITDSGLSVVRWGGNAASTYNWQLGTDNADNDYYFEDFTFGALNNNADSSSTQFIADVKNAGSNPLMTMVMLPWVAQSAESPGTGGNLHWSFPVTEYPNQCSVDQYNADAGNGILGGTCSNNQPSYITATAADLNRTYFPLLDNHTQTCPGGTTCVYRNDWAAALATAFGNGTCSVPYFPITSCHFYDMDNEIDIWGGTHFDIHPNPSGYDELASTYLTQAANLKTWDPAAVRFGPVSCCWWFYWNGANGNDRNAHGGDDFLPWWLNQVYWQDQISGARTLDVFDIHAYPDADLPSTTAAKQALAVSIYRDYWDPTFVSPSSSINQQYTTYIEPDKTIPFRIPRMRAIVNTIYPDTPLSMTEWSAAFVGESDFSTALGDADAYGILGRERVSFASRWEAPIPTNPNYLALKLYTNYDSLGLHHGFGTLSVSDTNNGNPNLFSSYAALNAAGTAMTVMVLNKDPQNAATVTFSLNGFTTSSVTTYTLAASAPMAITKASPAWSSTMTFAPYTATLLAIGGSVTGHPASEWDLNPDTVMVPAGGTVTLQPKITSGTASVSLGAPQSDNGITVTVAQGNLTTTQNGTITVVADNTPGFYHYSVPGTDSGATQTQGGYIVVGNPAATFSTTTGGRQTGAAGSTLAQPLTVTLAPGSSGGTQTGACVLFSTDGGTLSNGTTTGPKAIAVTNSSGVASVTLTLPATNSTTIKVTAEGQYGLGHPVANFTEMTSP